MTATRQDGGSLLWCPDYPSSEVARCPRYGWPTRRGGSSTHSETMPSWSCMRCPGTAMSPVTSSRVIPPQAGGVT